MLPNTAKEDVNELVSVICANRHTPGAHSSWVALVRLMNKRFFKRVSKILDTNQLPDIIQDTWETVFGKLDTICGHPNPEAFINTVFRSRNIDSIRRTFARIPSQPRKVPEELADFQNLNAEQMYYVMCTSEVFETYKSRHSRGAKIIERIALGSSSKEIAGDLGMTEGAVRTAAWDARKKLLDMLETTCGPLAEIF